MESVLLKFVDFLFSGPPYNVRSSPKNANFEYDLLIFESLADVVTHYKPVWNLRLTVI